MVLSLEPAFSYAEVIVWGRVIGSGSSNLGLYRAWRRKITLWIKKRQPISIWNLLIEDLVKNESKNEIIFFLESELWKQMCLCPTQHDKTYLLNKLQKFPLFWYKLLVVFIIFWMPYKATGDFKSSSNALPFRESFPIFPKKLKTGNESWNLWWPQTKNWNEPFWKKVLIWVIIFRLTAWEFQVLSPWFMSNDFDVKSV